MSVYQDTLAGSALSVVSQRTVGDLTGLNLGNTLEIRERIGRGGMGSVYLAHHRDWDLNLAVKSPRPDLLSNDRDKERWLLEAQTWIDLGVHPNIVRCWFIREHEGTPLLFLDYVSGGSLKEALEQRRFGVANWPKLLDLAIQACDGLAHAHQSGIVHRDVKPANFLLDDDGRLFVTDFGLVKVQGADSESRDESRPVDLSEVSPGLTSTGTVLGTPNYCAPEQWMQQDVGIPADLYAMGVVLYEMSVGQLPFEAGPGPMGLGQLLSQVLSEDPQPPHLLQPAIPGELEAVILKLLSKDPADRFPTALSLRAELVRIYESLTAHPYPRPLPKPVEAVVDVLNNKAVSLYSLGRKKTAEETWQQALRLDSLHPDVVYNRGWLLWRQGRQSPNELALILRQVRATYARGAMHCGLAHLLGGEWEAAELNLASAAAEASADSTVWRHLGDARMGLERFGDAAQAYQKALELNPGDLSSAKHIDLAHKRTRRSGGHSCFPKHAALVHMQRARRLTQVRPAAGGWLWLGPDHMEWLPADSSHRSWSIHHDLGLRKVLVSPGCERIVAIESLPAGIWSLQTGTQLDALENGERFFCLSPDGKQAVAGLMEVHVLDLLQPGRPLKTLLGHEKQVLCALYCGSEKLLTGACDRTARCWDLVRGVCLRTFQGHRDFVTCLAYNAETGLALTGSQDCTARTWRLDTGEAFRVMEESAPVISVAFASQGRFAVLQTQEGEGYYTSVWDLRSGEMRRRLAGMSRVSPDGKFILSARILDGANLIEIREVVNGCIRRTFTLEGGPVADLAFSEDGRFFAVVTLGGDFLLYEFDEAYRVVPQELLLTNTRGGQLLEENRELFQRLLHSAEQAEASGDYSRARQELSLAREVPGYRRDPEARALTRRLGKHLSRGELLSCWEVRLLGGAGGSGVSPIGLIPNSVQAVTANEKILRLWDTESGNCIRGFPGHSEPIRAIAVHPDGTRAVTGSLDRSLRCWDLRSGETLGRMSLSKGGTIDLHWLPDSTKVLALTNLYSLCCMDFATGLEEFQVPATGVTWMLGLSGTQVWLGGAVAPGKLQIFDARTGLCVRQPSQWKLSSEAGGEGALLATTAVTYGSGRYGLSASPEGKLHLWDLSEGRHLAMLLDVQSRVSHLAISPDGLCLAIGMEGGWVQVWDLEKRSLSQVLEGPWGRLAGLALAHDGCELMILGSDETLRIWEMEWELLEQSTRKQLADTLPRAGLLSRLWRGLRK